MTGSDLNIKLARFLFQYRITPHSTTGVSPSELLLKRHLRSHLDLLSPSVEAKVQSCQERQKSTYDHHSKERRWKLGDLVCEKLCWCGYNRHYRSSFLQGYSDQQLSC